MIWLGCAHSRDIGDLAKLERREGLLATRRGREFGYLKFEWKHGHLGTKRNEKGLRIAEFTWRIAEGSHFAFCSSVLSPKGKDQVGGKREQSTCRRIVSRSSTMSPNDTEPMMKDSARWR